MEILPKRMLQTSAIFCFQHINLFIHCYGEGSSFENMIIYSRSKKKKNLNNRDVQPNARNCADVTLKIIVRINVR